MDKFKLFKCDTDLLDKLLSKIKEFFAEVGFSLNARKTIHLSDYMEVKILNELLVVNSRTDRKYPGFFQTDKPPQIENKKKPVELVHERVARVMDTNPSGRNTMIALNEVVVSRINYSAGVIAWTETELTKLFQMIVKLLKEKGMLHKFCNKSKQYRLRKTSVLGLQSMLLESQKQVSKV